MSDTFTNNLNLTKPAVGGSTDTWGTKINNDLDAVDAIFSATGTEVNVRFNTANFDDNKKALFGTGDDLEIYHSGTNNIISGASKLLLQSDNTVDGVELGSTTGSEVMAKFIKDGAVKLYHDNSLKLETASGGVDITGNITVSGTVDGRDLATDGTKLDGIAAGATNVTNTNQLTNGAGFLTSADGGNAAQVDGFDASTGGGNSKLIATESNGYFHVDNWVRVGSASGIFVDETNARHFYAPTSDSLWEARSSTTSYSGMKYQLSNGNIVGYYYADTLSQQGFLNPNNGSWSMRVSYGGDITATGNVTAYSDSRLKTDIKTLDSALDKVCSLRGVEYTRLSTGEKEIGVIAQEVKEVVPELVEIIDENTEGKTEDGLKDLHIMKYQNTVGLLIEAIKELEKKVSDLEGK